MCVCIRVRVLQVCVCVYQSQGIAGVCVCVYQSQGIAGVCVCVCVCVCARARAHAHAFPPGCSRCSHPGFAPDKRREKSGGREEAAVPTSGKQHIHRTLEDLCLYFAGQS